MEKSRYLVGGTVGHVLVPSFLPGFFFPFPPFSWFLVPVCEFHLGIGNICVEFEASEPSSCT